MRSLSVALAALALACSGPGPKPPGTDPCDAAYLHLDQVGCEPKKPASSSWVEVCRVSRLSGLFDLRCMNAADNVPAVEKCGVTCVGH